MKINEIRAHMLLNNVTSKDIAKLAGAKTPHQVNEVIRGRRQTAYIRKAIACAINKNVTEIWPEVVAGE